MHLATNEGGGGECLAIGVVVGVDGKYGEGSILKNFLKSAGIDGRMSMTRG